MEQLHFSSISFSSKRADVKMRNGCGCDVADMAQLVAPSPFIWRRVPGPVVMNQLHRIHLMQ
jgi:hypothetical protein